MKRSRSSQAGFTLVELLIVVIIVGILSSVAIPLYRATTKSAYGSEADAALGTIRSAFRTAQSMSITGDFSLLAAKYTAALGLKITNVNELRINTTDLEGRFFDANCYRLTVLTNTTYTVQAIGDSSQTANKAAVAGLTRQIDQSGSLSSP